MQLPVFILTLAVIIEDTTEITFITQKYKRVRAIGGKNIGLIWIYLFIFVNFVNSSSPNPLPYRENRDHVKNT